MTKNNSMRKRNLLRSIIAAELVLLVPLLAMLFSIEGWDWGALDFVVIGILLAGVGVGFEMILNGVKNNSHQAVIGVVLAACMILIWIELAVGIFTD